MTLSRWAVCAATVTGLALRLATLPEVTQGGRALWYDADSAYHMHRVSRTLANFPHVPWFDPDANAPDGYRYHWPTGYDALIAGTAWLAGAGHPSTGTVVKVGAWTPAVLGALTIPVVAWLAAEIGGSAVAGWAAWAMALLPAHILLTMAGRADHHAAEPLVWALAVACALAGLRTGQRRADLKVGLYDGNVVRTYGERISWIGMGTACAAAVAVWPGGIVVMMLLAFGLACSVFRFREPAPVVSGATLGLGVAFVGTLLICAAAPLARAGAWSYEELSWLQPFAALGGMLLPGAAGRRRWALAAAGGLTLVVAAWPGAFHSLAEGVGFILRTDPWIALTEESEPLLISGGMFTVSKVASHLSWLGFLLPGLVAWLLWRVRREPWAALAAVWLAGALGLMVAQTRFESAGAPVVAVLFGAAGASLAGRVGNLPAIALAVLLSAPAGLGLAGLREAYRTGTPFGATLELLDFFAARPDRGIVLAGPMLGHWIETYGGHPVIANSIHTNRAGNNDFARVCLTEDERVAEAMLARRQVRYVVVGEELLLDLQQAALALGVPAGRFLEPAGATVVWKEAGRRLILSRLYFDEGRGLAGFRPVFVSSVRGDTSPRPRYRVYEVTEAPRRRG